PCHAGPSAAALHSVQHPDHWHWKPGKPDNAYQQVGYSTQIILQSQRVKFNITYQGRSSTCSATSFSGRASNPLGVRCTLNTAPFARGIYTALPDCASSHQERPCSQSQTSTQRDSCKAYTVRPALRSCSSDK